MTVVYSIGVRFAGGGIGNIAWHAVRGLYRHRMLQRLLCGSFRHTEIPPARIRALGLPSRVLRRLAVYDGDRRLPHLDSVLFDRWAARQIVPASLFHVWGNFGLRSLRRAKAMGMVTVVERASSHPLFQARLLREEYSRWGLIFRSPPATLERGLAEMELADFVLVPSDFVRQTFVEQGFPAGRLLQIPFGVDPARFWPANGHTDRPFRVLFAGQVGIRKGVPYLLDAWRRLNWRDAELWLVGRPAPEFPPLLAGYRDMPGLHVIGHAGDPAAIFRQADLFAFPTLEEGSALVTYEALASGLPVVTTPHAGSVVRDGAEGCLVPIRDVGALAGALDRLRTDDRRRAEMGRAARARAAEFTWDAYGDRLAHTLQQLA